jgi:hypothetical protein
MILKIRTIGILITLLFCSACGWADTPGDISTGQGMITVKLQKELGLSGNPNEKPVNRPVRISFSHSDHGYGFAKMVWDNKRTIRLEASIKKAGATFPVYPYNIRIVLYDPQNKIIRNEGQNIGLTWQNYEWSGPGFTQTWDPAITSTYSIAQKPLTELSANPFGIWTVIFYKDLNLGKDASGNIKWGWEPLAKYNFEILDGTKPGLPPPTPDSGPATVTVAGDVFGTVGQTVADIVSPGHKVQVWEVLPEYTQTGTYRVSIQHAKAGDSGSFFHTAWADIDGDGLPDREIGRSERKIAGNDCEWSSWTFENRYQRIFIGNLWDRSDERIYYQMGGALKGYSGLDKQVFYSRDFNQAPRQKTGPRYTNIRFEILSGRNSFTNPLNIDGRFVMGKNPLLQQLDKSSGVLRWDACAYPWVAIEGDGSSRFCYYSFTVKPGSKGIFDIDRGFRGNQPGSADLKIVLWNAQGAPMAGSDNLGAFSWFFGSDPGGEEDPKGLDPYFEWTFIQGGLYIIGIAASGDKETAGGWSETGTGLKPGNRFILNIAIENHEYHGIDSSDYFQNQNINETQKPN